MTTWQHAVADKQRRQHLSLPPEWILPHTVLPPPEHLDVLAFPETCGLLSSKEVEITNTGAEGLLERMRGGGWKAVEVVRAFAKRAVVAHQLTNCLTEVFIDRALARAAELDEYFKKTGQLVGPLHGIPISLKDQIDIKGIESTIGYAAYIGKYAERNAVLVDILEALGAILFVKTNLPQVIMWPETFNHVFGRTVNPHNRSLTCGGSSGGEGALIALKGSVIGVGSDLGGSVRIPSAFCGIYGLRPSYGRMPAAGATATMRGQDSILSVFGPHAGSISALKAFTQGVLTMQPWTRDPLVHRKGWDEDAYRLGEHGGGGTLCFGFLWDNGNVVPHPPVVRALQIVQKALLAAGHKVVNWKPYKHVELCATSVDIFSSGLTDDVLSVIETSGEPRVTSMVPGEEHVTDRPTRFPKQERSAYELWQIHKRKTDLRQEYLEYWEASVGMTGTGRPVDAVISPVAPFTATPHGQNSNAHYTTVWSVLDYPALVLPVCKVDQYLDKKKPAHAFLSAADEANYVAYTPEAYMNAPVAIQVVGRTLEEEAVIGMSEIVDSALKSSMKARL